MSAKFKLLFCLILTTLATVATAIYIWQREQSTSVATKHPNQNQFFTVSNPRTNLTVEAERKKYKIIPIDEIDAVRQGTDPKALALDVFDEIEARKGQRQIEVDYPEPDLALVTITQTQKVDKLQKAIKYRVEMTSFGRTLLVNSPPMWQIIWAGSQRQCTHIYANNRTEVKPCN